MKNFLHSRARSVLHCSVVPIVALCLATHAQDNVWTSNIGGNWQDASWSLGIAPATNQTIWVTNYGWKAVQIGADTAQSFPESLCVDAVNISSPPNTFNTLLLNYAGSATPLTVKSLTISSNSAVQMFSSALQINGPNGSGAMIGGQLDQNDSVVTGNQVNVGYIGRGIYNFNSGYFTVSNLWLGGGINAGVLNQNGGTNGYGITHLDGGTYVLSNGWFAAAIYFDQWGQFLQHGGLLSSDLTMFNGTYVLAGGVHQGWTEVPAPNGFSQGMAAVVQTGGTNSGAVEIGAYGSGSYTLSNGLCAASGLSVGPAGIYSQWDGNLQVGGLISVGEQQVAMYSFSAGQFNLNGGEVSSSGLSLQGFYSQSGGTNCTAGDITMNNVESSLSLSGGLLEADSLDANAGWQGGIFLTGGTLIVTNNLAIGGIGLPNWRGFQGGGELIVSNIFLGPDALFACRDGIIKQSGTLTLANATLYSASNCVQFGPLRLAMGGNTNSTLYLVAPTSIVKFDNSSGTTWSSEPNLVIEGWSGSFYGGGSQQIIFGNDSNGLTTTQLAQIQFHNPAGLTDGTYPARILSNGEIVPSAGGPLPANMALQVQPTGMQVTLHGEAGRNYIIETSTDLQHWTPWTNVVNSTGTMTVTDTDSTNYPARFYRARLAP
jgi:hypothetical protein